MGEQRAGLIASIAESVDRVITIDYGYGVIHELNQAARQRYGKSPAFLAAERLHERVRRGDVVLIATGCTYPGFELVVGEPDGPMGRRRWPGPLPSVSTPSLSSSPKSVWSMASAQRCGVPA